MSDSLRILGFAVCLAVGCLLYALIAHPHDLVRDWIDKAYFLAMGALLSFWFGPVRRNRRLERE